MWDEGIASTAQAEAVSNCPNAARHTNCTVKFEHNSECLLLCDLSSDKETCNLHERLYEVHTAQRR